MYLLRELCIIERAISQHSSSSVVRQAVPGLQIYQPTRSYTTVCWY